MPSEAISVLMRVVETLNQLQISYLVGGSIASALYGVSRSTLDADIVADMNQEHVSEFVKTLGDDFYADEEMIRGAIRHRSSFNLIHLQTMFKVDIFIPKGRAFDRAQFGRRTEQILEAEPAQKAFLASAEDIILAKLEWYRLGGEVSDRQWRDILGIFEVQADRLDLDYLKKWAVELKVYDLLERALSNTR